MPASPPEPAARVEPAPQPDTNGQDASASQGTQSIDAFLTRLDSATRAIHESAKKDPALIREGCRALLNETLDLDAMTEAANAEIWSRMTTGQRTMFRLAFEQRMIGNCVRQFGTYEGETMQLAGIRTTRDGQLLATVRVGPEDNGRLVTWRLPNSGPQNWRAIDVITEGRSAVLDARTEFAAVLETLNGDIEALIAFVQK
jgi:ABC-type transporter MlaC component